MDLFKWGKNSEKPSDFTEADAPVSQTMIWICEKCGAKVGGDDTARSVQKALKHEIGERGEKRQKRAMVTTCMNVCPKNEIAVMVLNVAQGAPKFLTVPWRGRPEDLARDLYSSL